MMLRIANRKLASQPRINHIAFVACNGNRYRFREDPSYIYRCENLGMALQALGYRVSLVHLTALSLIAPADVVVFHRPRYSLYLTLALYWLRRSGVTVVADVDDLVFDETLAEFSPGVINDLVPLRKTQAKFSANRQGMALFDAITVSTEPLQQHVNQRFPNARIAVLPNAVHQTWRQLQANADSGLNDDESTIIKENPIVTYFPGTRSHDRDFTVFAEGVWEFLSKYPDARLEVTGPLRFNLSARPGQVVHRDKLRFELYHERFRDSWINLAPLTDSPFNLCKSALKVLEAGYWGVPTVCTAIPDASRFVNSGALYAEDAEACYKQLNMLTDNTCYRGVTTGLSAKVLALADIDAVAHGFLRFVGILPKETI
ncbi:MAG: hypothetical protein ACXWT3_05385 [Methylococcaceae bacterium]